MKQIIVCFSMAVGFMASGCTEKPAQKEVIIVPASENIEKDKPANTSITLDENGVKVEAKDIDIEIKKD